MIPLHVLSFIKLHRALGINALNKYNIFKLTVKIRLTGKEREGSQF